MTSSTILQEQRRGEDRGSSSENHRVSDTRGQKRKQKLMQLNEVDAVDEEVHSAQVNGSPIYCPQPSRESLLFRPTPWEEGGGDRLTQGSVSLSRGARRT
jgi:hypothetical protein